jgi:hypothetical protein
VSQHLYKPYTWRYAACAICMWSWHTATWFHKATAITPLPFSSLFALGLLLHHPGYGISLLHCMWSSAACPISMRSSCTATSFYGTCAVYAFAVLWLVSTHTYSTSCWHHISSLYNIWSNTSCAICNVKFMPYPNFCTHAIYASAVLLSVSIQASFTSYWHHISLLYDLSSSAFCHT